MLNLSKVSFLCLVLIGAVLSACKDEPIDPACVAPQVSSNIVGTWKVTGGVSTVEFKADGTLLDPESDIIGGEINGDTLKVKTYVASNDSLYVKAASATSANFVDVTFPITGNACDTITLDFINIPILLVRQ